MGTLRQRFEVERPIAAVYEVLSHPAAILQSLPGITGVSRAADDVYRLSTREVPEIDFRITSKVPVHRVEWRAGDGAWTGAVELEPQGLGRTAVTIDAASTVPDADMVSATTLHDGVLALKRALQAPQVRVEPGGFDGSRSPGAAGREYAAQWREAARSAFARPTEFPLTVMRTLTRQMDRVVGDVLRASPLSRLPQMVPGLPWNPDVEVCEQDDHVRVCVDVPGVDEAHLQVDIDEGALTVRGERQDERANERGHRRSELHYGAFTRRIPLPEGIDPDSARAVLRNGVLEVRVPMHRKAPRRVPVHHEE